MFASLKGNSLLIKSKHSKQNINICDNANGHIKQTKNTMLAKRRGFTVLFQGDSHSRNAHPAPRPQGDNGPLNHPIQDFIHTWRRITPATEERKDPHMFRSTQNMCKTLVISDWKAQNKMRASSGHLPYISPLVTLWNVSSYVFPSPLWIDFRKRQP